MTQPDNRTEADHTAPVGPDHAQLDQGQPERSQQDWSQLNWQRPDPVTGEADEPYLEVAAGGDGRIYMRESTDPENVVITTQAKWDAFILGVKAGEFDDFAEEPPEG